MSLRDFFAGLFVLTLLAPAPAEPGAKIPVIVDTNIGSDTDDAFALALVLASPELDLRAVTTVGGQAEDRAWIVCRFLSHAGAKPVPVAFGHAPQPRPEIDWQIQYRRHPALIFNRTQKPAKESAVELMYQQLKSEPGKITIICLGPLTNVARLFREHPDVKAMVKRLVVMAGAVRDDYTGRPPTEPEWIVIQDVAAAKEVFASGVPLTLVPLEATATLELGAAERARIFAAHRPLTFQVQALYELWDREAPILFDSATVGLAVDESFATMEDLRVTVNAKGVTTITEGKPTARVATAFRKDAFMKWFVDRLRAHGKEALPEPPKNLSKLVEQGGFPVRVHAAEDYSTDIEKRWWMCGKLEYKDVRFSGQRACRATLTQDFDDKQGDLKTSYRAVIFNPVPGPPMGPNTRLSFQYKLTGTDRLRVQLYSLTNGYHRYLSLEKLPQGKWESATVDMTQMRRPDGSGGPLSENERIDPRAELLISDIVLYEAAAAGEKQGFPLGVMFTGWFDTGKQGKEWPGDFEIVPHQKPRTWNAARSVVNPKTGESWIRLGLRGERNLGGLSRLFFRYRLTGADSLTVEFHNSKTRKTHDTQKISGLKRDRWSDTDIPFDNGGSPKWQWPIDEIRILVPKGGRLMVDDILLYNFGLPLE